jgi:hypothetical protein
VFGQVFFSGAEATDDFQEIFVREQQQHQQHTRKRTLQRRLGKAAQQ